MPQTAAFRLLNDRLKTLPKHPLNSTSSGTPTRKLKKHGTGNKLPKDIDFAHLLSHFSAIQALHDEHRRKEVSDDVVTEEEAEKLFEMKLSESEHAEFSVVDDQKL